MLLMDTAGRVEDLGAAELGEKGERIDTAGPGRNAGDMLKRLKDGQGINFWE